MPVIVLLNSIPKIALAPLFLLWFGYGIQSKIFVAVLIAFFPVLLNTVTGLIDVDDNLLDLVQYLNASKWQIFTKIRIPNALPHLFAGVKISATMCVVGSIVGEFIASKKGLGRLLRSAQANIDMATMFACLVLLSVMGLLLFWLISKAEKLCMPWTNRAAEEE
jgi:NitT/TauT family transport system permease protein